MITIKTVVSLQKEINKLKAENKTIGFVPTMGALHQGHLSLVEQSKKQSDITVVSIFVNPTQFNNKSDLEKYPRTIEQDLEMLKSKNVDIVFMPDEKEMYPEKDTRKFNFGNLETDMEGKFRDGHFNGVAQIVSKLFDFVKPNKAFFGLKDFQQVAIIKAMVRQLEMPIEIVPCPIIREQNGLAMSSRNQRLSNEQKQDATILYKTLKNITENYKDFTPTDLQNFSIKEIEKNSNLKVEYLEIIDDNSLKTINNWNESKNISCCVAAYCGDIRLIDNMQLE
jgi:pantoate--beta-alanine ligase